MVPLEKTVFQHLKNKGGEPFITGGTVRDKQLGSVVRDMDVVVFGMDDHMLRCQLEHFGIVLSYGKSFRVYQIRGLAVEFSLPRNKKRHKNESLELQLQQDAEGRDFTVNALYMNPLTEEIIDPLNGLDDLSQKRLRMTSKHTFVDDPLRVLRAIQLCARMGFSVEEKTMEAMRHATQYDVAMERVYEELNKWLMSNDPGRGWEIMEETGHVPAICQIEERLRPIMGDVLGCGASLRNQSNKPVQWMWSVLLAPSLLIKCQHQKRQAQKNQLHCFVKAFGDLSNHHEHIQYVSKMLWGLAHFQHYSIRKPDVARLSLGVDLDELTLTVTALMPFWNHIGKQKEVQQAMYRIKKMRPHEKIKPLVKGNDLKKWGFTEGKVMGMLLETAFQLQLEEVSRDQIEFYFKKHQRLLEKRGH